jgi:hypothetical protein
MRKNANAAIVPLNVKKQKPLETRRHGAIVANSVYSPTAAFILKDQEIEINHFAQNTREAISTNSTHS